MMANNEVLVVDDERGIREVYREALCDRGCKVYCAESGEKALEILGQERTIRVMLLDLNLPGMHGVELGRRIREDNPVAFICAVTGHASRFELVDCLRAGFSDYMLKPVRLYVLQQLAYDAFKRLERWELTLYHRST
jgi:CheY-like chemotaxis protein